MINFEKKIMLQCSTHIAHNSIALLLISEEIATHGSFELTTVYKKMKLQLHSLFVTCLLNLM
jgi:tetrahydromethanopterin S-methyltransferase subunit C